MENTAWHFAAKKGQLDITENVGLG